MTDKPKLSDLVSRKLVAELLEVTVKTVKRWEKKYGWTVIEMNGRNKRLLRSEVENTLQLQFPEKV